MDKGNQSIAKVAFIVMIMAAFSRVVGFFRETVIAAVFGAGAITDAYAVALRTVNTAALVSIIFLSQVFVPIYLKSFEEKGEKKALWIANNFFVISVVFNLVMMVLLHLIAPLVVLATGFDAEQAAVVTVAINILMFQLPFIFHYLKNGSLLLTDER